jgi:hypothetical protein
LNIKLSKVPPSRSCNGQDNANGSCLDHRTECILIVNSIPLFVPFGDNTSFVSLKRPICLLFDFKQPHAINDIFALMRRY